MASSQKRYAPIWKRGIAAAIDSAMMLVLLYVLLLIKEYFNNITAVLIYLSLVWMVPMVYFIASEALYGQTIGKKIMKIVVIKINGEKIGFKESFIRNLLRVVDVLPFFYILGMILIFSTLKNQRLGDMAAKTIVILENEQ